MIALRSWAVAFVLFGFAWAGGIAQAQLRRVTAVVTPVVGSDGVHAGTEMRAALQVALPEGFHVQSDRPRDPSLIPTMLTVEPPAGVSVVELVYPSPTDLTQIGADQPLAVFEREFAIGLRLIVSPDVRTGEMTVPGRLRYQACDDRRCFAPTTAEAQWTLRVVPPGTPVTAQHSDVLDQLPFGRGQAPKQTAPAAPAKAAQARRADDGVAQLDGFTILRSAGGYLGSEDFLTFIRNAETGVQEAGWFEGHGPLAILLIVFLGGLALNLTPCVLPMIPINLAIIGAGAQVGSRWRGLLLGATYGAAMALVYGILGLIVILTASTFGTINASPWFNAGIAALFVVLGLAMFDIFLIDFSRFSSRFQVAEARRGTFLVAFTMGGVAALLAGACVAPVVIQVVLFSSNLYAAGTSAALALPFFLGIGMALPWPIAGAGIAALPKPGAWMVRVKQAFGIVILATATYYGYTAYGLFASRWVDPVLVASSVEAKLKEGWHASLAEGLAAAQCQQQPVLIDLWATWCKNCLTMDKTTLADPAVTAALSGYVKVKLQAESPDESPTREVMQRFGAIGLPTYVILRPAP
ncbi:MAG: thioredoxin family protein [Acidobacteria bacterium]|nr:thioredoxin family protein [Acidobacteriota bacterium]